MFKIAQWRTTLTLVLVFGHSAWASPGILSTPALYDNSDPAEQYGQLFQADSLFISGIDFYIGDPTRPNNATVNALTGPADLVLYDATNLNAPVQLERTQVQGDDGYAFGLTEFDFATPIASIPGHYYDIAVDAADEFGLGLTNQNNSTYAFGYESNVKNGVIGEAGGNSRDTSFTVLNAAPVPEPGSVFGLLAATLLARRRRRLSGVCEGIVGGTYREDPRPGSRLTRRVIIEGCPAAEVAKAAF